MSRILSLCLCGLLCGAAIAAEPAPTPAPAPLATARQLGLQRDPAFFPYAKLHDWLKNFQSHPGALRLETRLQPLAPGAGLQGVKFYLIGDRFQQEIPLGPQGEFTLPLQPEALAARAELYSNRKPGELTVQAAFWLDLPATRLPARDFRLALDQAKAQLKAMTPWYQRAQMAIVNLFGHEEGAVFVLPAGATAELEQAGRRSPLKPDAKTGRVVVNWRDDWQTAPATLHFSAAPQRVLPFFGKTPSS